MAFNYFNGYDILPANNSANAPDGAPEGMPAGDVNDAIRQLMSATAESHDSYVALIANNPSLDDAAPTALPAAAWTYEYADAAQIDVDNAWSVQQNFSANISAGSLAADGAKVELRALNIATINFNTVGDAANITFNDQSNLSGQGPGEMLMDKPLVGGIGYFTSIHAVASVSGVNGIFSGDVSGVGGNFTGTVSGLDVSATDLVSGDRLQVGTPAGGAPAVNSGAVEGDLDVDGTITGGTVVSDNVQNVAGDAYLSGGPDGNYPAETPVQFTASTIAVALPGDRGKLCVASGAVGYTGTPIAGDRFDVFNDTAATIAVTGLDDVAGNGAGTGNQVQIPPWQAGTFMRNPANDQWLFVGSGNVA